VLFDADLAVLAADTAEYDRYAAAVREEYAHVPDDQFVAGRSAVLRRLLKRRIFSTTVMRPREAAARANLLRELRRLDPTPGSFVPVLPGDLPLVAAAVEGVVADEAGAGEKLRRACRGVDVAVPPGELVVWAWVFDPDVTHVVLVDHPNWSSLLPPGGRFDPGEHDPHAAALRELTEETGLGADDVRVAHTAAALVDEVAYEGVETYGLAFAFFADLSVSLTGEDGQPAAWYPLDAEPDRVNVRHWARVIRHADWLRRGTDAVHSRQ
jgi:8-oxo-dGTP pyrophosphatase MutT (NUDIX family)